MRTRIRLRSAACGGVLCVALLAGPAFADVKDPLSADTQTQQGQDSVTTEIVSQGMRSMSGDIFSQGMMVDSGPWAGEIYSQGMQMSSGDVYSQGMEITIAQGSTNSQPLSQDCLGTASNCTPNVTNTPVSTDLPTNQSAPSGTVATASSDPIPEPASLALFGSALLWLGLVRYRRNRM